MPKADRMPSHRSHLRKISVFTALFLLRFIAMASIAFQAALTGMGFNKVTREFFTLNGINCSVDLTRMLPKDVTLWVSQSARTSAPVRGANIADGILFPFFSMKKLRAYRSWSLYRAHCLMPLTENAFTPELQVQWVDHGDMLASEPEFDDDSFTTKS